MPFRHLVLPEARLGAVAFHGRVTGACLAGAIETLFTDPAWEPDFDALWDGRAAHSIVLDLEDLERIARSARRVVRRAGTGRGVVIAPQDDAYAVAMLIWKRHASPSGRAVFLTRSLPEALARLGLPHLPEALADVVPPPRTA